MTVTAQATSALSWQRARTAAYEAGAAQPAPAAEVPLESADGATLARPLLTRTDLPAFPTSRVDGWATPGPAPLPGDGRVRDSLGPSVPACLRRLGADAGQARGPVEDTLPAHVAALRAALDDGADIVCTTGGTMHGPVDHLHPALHELGAEYMVNTVEVRPGFPMLLASVASPRGGRALVAGLPGNPQSAIVALVSLVAPALAGLSGRPLPELRRIRLTEKIPGRGRYTHLALVDRDGRPVSHVGSSMLRGLAGAVGFAVIPPGTEGVEGDEAMLVPLPL